MDLQNFKCSFSIGSILSKYFVMCEKLSRNCVTKSFQQLIVSSYSAYIVNRLVSKFHIHTVILVLPDGQINVATLKVWEEGSEF